MNRPETLWTNRLSKNRLRALAARRRSGENHPAPDELVAYRAGDLTPEEDDRIKEHLTQCRDCARLLLDLAEFEQLTTPPEELGPVDVRSEASWQRLRSRLREGDEPAMEPPVLRHRRAPVCLSGGGLPSPGRWRRG